jgi:hypothetical protein
MYSLTCIAIAVAEQPAAQKTECAIVQLASSCGLHDVRWANKTLESSIAMATQLATHTRIVQAWLALVGIPCRRGVIQHESAAQKHTVCL